MGGHSFFAFYAMHMLFRLPVDSGLRPSCIVYERDCDWRPRLLFRPGQEVIEGGIHDFQAELRDENAW